VTDEAILQSLTSLVVHRFSVQSASDNISIALVAIRRRDRAGSRLTLHDALLMRK
jgi:hypothetical protein